MFLGSTGVTPVGWKARPLLHPLYGGVPAETDFAVPALCTYRFALRSHRFASGSPNNG